MEMELRFTCACCGEKVEGLPDLAYAAPLHYDSLAEGERATRATLTDDFCVIDEDEFFIRAVCPIPIVGREETFGWGVWVSLGSESYQRYREAFNDSDQSRIGGMFGWFCNRIPVYPDTLHLQTSVIPQDHRRRPLVWINEASKDHPLYREQREGMSLERLGEVYAQVLCANSRK